MLPDTTLSTTTISAPFLEPREIRKEPLIDWTRGGIGIQDSSFGLDVYNWRTRYTGAAIVTGVPGIISDTTVVTVADVTELQLTFDQNMQPFVTYMVNDTDMYFRWYDGTVPGFVTTSISEAWSPRCDMDDRRVNAGQLSGLSDIILAYLKGTSLYARIQRDRYLVEYLLGGPYPHLLGLGQVGMNYIYRFQFQLKFPHPQSMDIRSVNFRVHPETERGQGVE